MSDITKSADATLSLGNGKDPMSRVAGVEIGAGDAMYADSNGLWQKAGTAIQFTSGSAGTEYKFDGLAIKDIHSGTVGEAAGLGSEFFYADSGLTIGAPVFPSATAGKLADAKVNANDAPVAKAISATNIVLIKGG